MDTGIPWDTVTGGMTGIGLVPHMAAHAGLAPITTVGSSMAGTGTAIAAGVNTTITGTANMIVIIVNVNESTIVISNI
jgi:hypothetical protein